MTFDPKKHPVLFVLEYLFKAALTFILIVAGATLISILLLGGELPRDWQRFQLSCNLPPKDSTDVSIYLPGEPIKTCYVILIYDIRGEALSLQLEDELRKNRINNIRYFAEDGRYYIYVGPRYSLEGAKLLLQAVEKHVGRRKTTILNVATMTTIDGYLMWEMMTPLLEDMCQ